MTAEKQFKTGVTTLSELAAAMARCAELLQRESQRTLAALRALAEQQARRPE